jgi:hypothetical protein
MDDLQTACADAQAVLRHGHRRLDIIPAIGKPEERFLPGVFRNSPAPGATECRAVKGDSIMGDMLQPWHLLVLMVVAIPVVLITVLPYWQIFKKAGFSPSLSLLMLVPFVGIIVLFVVAFSDWPALRKPAQGAGWIPPAS